MIYILVLSSFSQSFIDILSLFRLNRCVSVWSNKAKEKRVSFKNYIKQQQ